MPPLGGGVAVRGEDPGRPAVAAAQLQRRHRQADAARWQRVQTGQRHQRQLALGRKKLLHLKDKKKRVDGGRIVAQGDSST